MKEKVVVIGFNIKGIRFRLELHHQKGVLVPCQEPLVVFLDYHLGYHHQNQVRVQGIMVPHLCQIPWCLRGIILGSLIEVL